MSNLHKHRRNDQAPLYLSFRRSLEISNEAFSANQRQVRTLLKFSQDGLYPELYADCLCSGYALALNEYNDFLEQLSERDPARAISLHSQVMDEMQTRDRHSAPLEKVAKLLEKKGRDGDTILAHITPAEARHLKNHGGAGTRNPEPGYWNSCPEALAAQSEAPFSSHKVALPGSACWYETMQATKLIRWVEKQTRKTIPKMNAQAVG